jgi:hypothetical protein
VFCNDYQVFIGTVIFYFCALFAQLLPWQKMKYLIVLAADDMPQKPRQKRAFSGG